MEIIAAIARPGEPFTLEPCELEGPRTGEIRVRMLACGICHTDLTAHLGLTGTPLPAVLGHEGVGEVIDLGEGVDEFAIGDRVVMSFGSCGACGKCTSGAPGYCKQAWLGFRGTRADGSSPISQGGTAITGHFFAQSSFATHAVARTNNVVRLPPDVPSELAAPLACGVQTGMASVMIALGASASDSVAVFGCGTVGLSAIAAAAILGCRTIAAIDLDPNRLALAQELGATHVFPGAPSDALPKALRGLGGISRAVDTTGVPEVIGIAFAALGPQGVLACAGVSKPGATFPLDLGQLLLSGKSVRGTIEGDAVPRDFIPKMIAWYREGRLPLEKLVTTYPFADIARAVADVKAGRTVKPVLVMT